MCVHSGDTGDCVTEAGTEEEMEEDGMAEEDDAAAENDAVSAIVFGGSASCACHSAYASSTEEGEEQKRSHRVLGGVKGKENRD